MISKKEGLTVGDIIDELSKFPRDIKVYDYGYEEFCSIHFKHWADSNYPYNKPDEDRLVIDIDEYYGN